MDCYWGIHDDIQTLKEEGWLREIIPSQITQSLNTGATDDDSLQRAAAAAKKDTSKEQRVLFPINKEEHDVEVIGQIPPATLKCVREVWWTIEKGGDFKWEAILEENNLLSGFQSELLIRNQVKKQNLKSDMESGEVKHKTRAKQ